MILHLMIVDDEEDVLESMVPGLVTDLAHRLEKDAEFQKANKEAGFPLPRKGRCNIKVTASGYQSTKLSKHVHRTPVHVRLHLCCEKGGSFRHALRLLKEQFFAVVVSDLRFADDVVGSRAGKFFIEDVIRRNPETFGILYSAYQKPEGFPAGQFIRKGSASNLGGEELVSKIVEGMTAYLRTESIQRTARELGRRGLIYQSDAFGAMLRRLYDYASLYFGEEPPNEHDRRRPRPMLLIDGETGTGKTELAGLLHRICDRRDQPFVSATCNQLSDENFLRSILFGHIKGSFSGANADRPGLVQTAGGGILLLDDLHKLSDGCSLILHSFLDDGEYSHLGQDEIRHVAKTAIVATVEAPSWEEIKAEQLLAESFINRVEQLVLRVPPLRARPEDIEYQAMHYCAVQSEQLGVDMELSPDAIAWLVDYGFPGGNSRRLRDFLKGAITSHARVTDYLDVPELEEYAEETRLLRKGRPLVAVPKEAPPPSVPHAEPSAIGAWPPAKDPSGWPFRVAELATQALIDEYGFDPDEARTVCRSLFEEHYPRLWSEMRALVERPNSQRPMDIKLFDELLRYFAVYLAGNPAKAAKDLVMKDNALREFIYSREQKRKPTESKS